MRKVHRQKVYGFRSLVLTRVVQARNQQRFRGVIQDAEATWRMLLRHFLNGWSSISKYRIERERLGLNKLRRVFSRSMWLQASKFIKRIKSNPEKLAYLATMEKRFKMNPGALKQKTFGYYMIGDDGNIQHQTNERVLGRLELRINHGCLTLYDLFRGSSQFQQKMFFYKALAMARAKEFLDRVDIFYHRVLARIAIKRIKQNWIFGFDMRSQGLHRVQNLINRSPKKYRCTDYEEFMKKRERTGKGAAVAAGVEKLKRLINRKPNQFIRKINNTKERSKNLEQKRREIFSGGLILLNISRNYKNWSFNKIRNAYHSGLLMHNDYLSRKLNEIKIEYMKKLVQEATYVLEGTIERHRRNDANFFMIRLLNPNLILNRTNFALRIIKHLMKMKRFMNIKKAFEKLKVVEKKKKPIDLGLVEEFVDALSYLFNNRKSEAFGSIQSYVMEFEVLKIEEVSNSMVVNLNSHGHVSTVLDNALERTLVFDKNPNLQHNLSRNSIDSRSFN